MMNQLRSPTSAAAVANEFLDLAAREPSLPAVDQMKLQKLVYYAHAWYLAINGRPLFDDDVEAWPWGPVIRQLYVEFKDFGRKPITARARSLQRAGSEIVFTQPVVEDSATKTFIRAVWDAHKKFTGIQLSNATHAPGEPWTIVKEKYKTLESKPTIPNDLMSEVFRSKMKT